MFKDLLTLSRTEQRGLLVLVILLVLMLLLRIGLPSLYAPVDFSQLVTDSLLSSWVRVEEPDAANPDVKGLRTFDPNSIDSVQLIAFGLDHRTASNWVKYLKAGGRFYSAEDIGKLYGMSRAWLSAATPYVDIQKNRKGDFETHAMTEHSVYLDLNRMDSLALLAVGWSIEMVDSVLLWQKKHWFSKRYHPTQLHAWNMDSLLFVRESMTPKSLMYSEQDDLVIRINEADTAEWSLLRGVGPVLSRRIVSYKKALGGFVSINQVAEVYGISPILFEDVKSFLIMDTIELDVIDINRASLRRLRNHPYMDFYMAKTIVEARKENGYFTHIDQVAMLKGFDNKQWEMLKPYLKVQVPSE